MFDAHLHLSGLRHPQAVLEALKSGALDSCLVSTVTESEAGELLNRLQDYPAFLTLGAHPCFTRRRSFDRKALDLLLQSPRGGRLVAIGECGFDRHSPLDDREQEQLLLSCAEAAVSCNLPLVLHLTQRRGRALDLLKDFPALKVHVHWASGSHEILRRYVKAGWTLGVCVSDSSAPERFKSLPVERLLPESDFDAHKEARLSYAGTLRALTDLVSRAAAALSLSPRSLYARLEKTYRETFALREPVAVQEGSGSALPFTTHPEEDPCPTCIP